MNEIKITDRETAIRHIEGLFPPDSDNPENAKTGQFLLKQAKQQVQCLGWSKCDFVSPAHKYVQENIIRPRWKQIESSKRQPVQLELFKAS